MPFDVSYFYSQRKAAAMRSKKLKRLYPIVVEFGNGMTRAVKVKASSREVAEKRALKFHPSAKGVKRDA